MKYEKTIALLVVFALILIGVLLYFVSSEIGLFEKKVGSKDFSLGINADDEEGFGKVVQKISPESLEPAFIPPQRCNK